MTKVYNFKVDVLCSNNNNSRPNRPSRARKRQARNLQHNTVQNNEGLYPPPGNGDKVCVGGGAGFIGSHIAKRLKLAGYYVIVVDWKENEFMTRDEFCDEFILDDLRKLEVACKACEGCTQVYNLAADMGGMGFICSNESVLAFNNTAISMNMLEGARRNGVKNFFYASSACVYNEAKQEDPANPGLIESDAWPARPQDVYGLEKLYAEEMALAYGDVTLRSTSASRVSTTSTALVEPGRVAARRHPLPFAARPLRPPSTLKCGAMDCRHDPSRSSTTASRESCASCSPTVMSPSTWDPQKWST
jgi:hypothetical protein